MIMKNKKLLVLVAAICISFKAEISTKMSEDARAKGFVYLKEVDPTIQVSLRYATQDNFMGRHVEGYKEPVVMLTRRAAEALKQVQEEVVKDGYCLVVYDTYRPQRSVDSFVAWGENEEDQLMKGFYYPREDKDKVFEHGYIAKKSGHSRGSTVDVTLIKLGKVLHTIVVSYRLLLDGFIAPFLDDGTVDMGTSFDLFDKASHHGSDLIPDPSSKKRTYLKNVMERCGFKALEEEWWHYTLKDEPYPAGEESSYFNFAIE